MGKLKILVSLLVVLLSVSFCSKKKGGSNAGLLLLALSGDDSKSSAKKKPKANTGGDTGGDTGGGDNTQSVVDTIDLSNAFEGIKESIIYKAEKSNTTASASFVSFATGEIQYGKWKELEGSIKVPKGVTLTFAINATNKSASVLTTSEISASVLEIGTYKPAASGSAKEFNSETKFGLDSITLPKDVKKSGIVGLAKVVKTVKEQAGTKKEVKEKILKSFVDSLKDDNTNILKQDTVKDASEKITAVVDKVVAEGDDAAIITTLKTKIKEETTEKKLMETVTKSKGSAEGKTKKVEPKYVAPSLSIVSVGNTTVSLTINNAGNISFTPEITAKKELTASFVSQFKDVVSVKHDVTLTNDQATLSIVYQANSTTTAMLFMEYVDGAGDKDMKLFKDANITYSIYDSLFMNATESLGTTTVKFEIHESKLQKKLVRKADPSKGAIVSKNHDGTQVADTVAKRVATISGSAYNAKTQVLTLEGKFLCPNDLDECLVGDQYTKAQTDTELSKLTIGGVATALDGNSLLTDALTAADITLGDTVDSIDQVKVKKDGTQIQIKFVKAQAEAELNAVGKPFISNHAAVANGIQNPNVGIVFGLPANTGALTTNVSGYDAFTLALTSTDDDGNPEANDTLVFTFNKVLDQTGMGTAFNISIADQSGVVTIYKGGTSTSGGDVVFVLAPGTPSDYQANAANVHNASTGVYSSGNQAVTITVAARTTGSNPTAVNTAKAFTVKLGPAFEWGTNADFYPSKADINVGNVKLF